MTEENPYPDEYTIPCKKCKERFNPDVSGLKGICDTCFYEGKK